MGKNTPGPACADSAKKTRGHNKDGATPVKTPASGKKHRRSFLRKLMDAAKDEDERQISTVYNTFGSETGDGGLNTSTTTPARTKKSPSPTKLAPASASSSTIARGRQSIPLPQTPATPFDFGDNNVIAMAKVKTLEADNASLRRQLDAANNDLRALKLRVLGLEEERSKLSSNQDKVKELALRAQNEVVELSKLKPILFFNEGISLKLSYNATHETPTQADLNELWTLAEDQHLSISDYAAFIEARLLPTEAKGDGGNNTGTNGVVSMADL